MRVSVILSTYNAPAWLEKVIWGYLMQDHQDFELLIADDGSTRETAQVIERMRAETGLCIRHIWHADIGFRKCAILNRAILAAEHDYLVFSDGDCVPRHDFLAQHVAMAQPGHLLSGGTVRLPQALSERLNWESIVSGQATNPRWLVQQGLPITKKLLLLSSNPRLARWLDTVTTTRATWNGHNASSWKEDILRVNGYDERMEYGGLDRELGERLMNDSVKPLQIRHRAVCVHLDHARGYIRKRALQRNRAIRNATRQQRLVWTAYGIRKGNADHVVRQSASPLECSLSGYRDAA